MKSRLSSFVNILSFGLLIIVVAGCKPHLSTSVVMAPSVQHSDSQIDPLLIPNDTSSIVFENLRYSRAVLDLYRYEHYAPIWLENELRTDKADSMILMIMSARKYGLLPHRYHFHEIPDLVLEPRDRMKMIRLDVVLTDAFLAMAHDLKYGCLQEQKENVKFDTLELVGLTDSIRTSGVRVVLESYEPIHAGYKSLKQALNALLDSVNLVDQNLLMSGITVDSSEVHRKVQRIEINLERWRTEKQPLDKLYTWVNIPAYMFYVIENNEILMQSRIVVGTPVRQTPQFSSSIECFTIFPYWYVPRKIAVEEYLPVIRKDTSFITRNNFDVLDRSGKIQKPASIDWKKYNANNFPFTLRQREGTENSLGIIKFVFDNPYAVFLHDTNAKKLFSRKVRALSHGCIRLEKASEFAHFLIKGNRATISSLMLDKYLSEKKRRTISLSSTIPIHIRYFTCEVRNDTLIFYDDVYQKDHALIRQLYKGYVF
jgi:murein L,D-transpeptidase YcbB/YkuD